MPVFKTNFSTQSESKFETNFGSNSDVYEKILNSLKTPYIGENGNWYEWDIESQSFVDTGVKSAGYTPVKGVDYWTPNDIATVQGYIDEQTEIIKSDVEGLQKQIKEEAHFRGYSFTNEEILSSKATPNDFAYSAESGTVWVYDAEDGWEDTGTPVPDQLTPASNATPLVNGVASPGQSEEYARGDHRHPTDTSRASVEQLNGLKSDLENRIPRLIKKVTVAEDVASVTISTDEEGNPFALSDFEIRFTGKHSTTMWLGIGKGEKYFSTASVANNQGLPFFNTISGYSTQNVVVRYIFSGSNYCGIKYQQEIGALGDDGKYATGNGKAEPFNTTPVSSPAKNIIIQAISGGVIKAGTVIEVWGY